MAGHSKWANIKHRKAAADAKKGKVFTRLIKEITVAARMGGGDPNSNPRLRMMLDKARDANMTKDSVQRAVQRGTGELEGVAYEEARYEGYGAGGAAVLVECLTDNRTRTVAEVRHALPSMAATWAPTGRSRTCSSTAASSYSRRARARTKSWRRRSMRAPKTC